MVGPAPPARLLGRSPLAPPGVTAAPTAGHGVALSETGALPRSVTVAKLAVLTADPTGPVDGEAWIRSDTNQLRWRADGVTYQVTGTPV